MKELTYYQLRKIDNALKIGNDAMQALIKNPDDPRFVLEAAICQARLAIGLFNTESELLRKN